MKAVVVSKFGSPEGLKIKDLEEPTPKKDELLVKIHATTVTFGDAWLRRMKLPARWVLWFFMGGLRNNRILGHEFAGEVKAIGSGVTLFNPGQKVFASTGMRGGAHAEYICIPEDSMVAELPVNMSFEEAAAVPVGGNTALYILGKADIQSSQDVLIYGASGSVGSYAVQLAKHWGARVTGVCSTSNLDWVRELGCDEVIDYTEDDFTETGDTYDVIFDAVRKVSKSQCKKSLKENGVFLSTRSSTKETAENLVFLKELIEAGKLKSVIDRTYSLEDIIEAHRHVDTGHKKGNVVISITHH